MCLDFRHRWPAAPRQIPSTERLFFSLRRQNNDVSLELYDFTRSFISQTIYSYCSSHIQVKFKLYFRIRQRHRDVSRSFQNETMLWFVFWSRNIYSCV